MGKLVVVAAETLQAVAWRLAPDSRFAEFTSHLFLKAFFRFDDWQTAFREGHDAFLREQQHKH